MYAAHRVGHATWPAKMKTMMASANGSIFHVNGLCVGNSPVTGEFPVQRPVTRSFDVVFFCARNTRLSKQLAGWWFQTPSRSWRHCNGIQDRPFRRRTMILKACFSISCCWYVSFESVPSELLYVFCFVSDLFFHVVSYYRTLVNTTSKRGLHFDFEPW